MTTLLGEPAVEEKQFRIDKLHNDLVLANNEIRFLTSELKMARGKIVFINRDNTDLN